MQIFIIRQPLQISTNYKYEHKINQNLMLIRQWTKFNNKNVHYALLSKFCPFSCWNTLALNILILQQNVLIQLNKSLLTCYLKPSISPWRMSYSNEGFKWGSILSSLLSPRECQWMIVINSTFSITQPVILRSFTKLSFSFFLKRKWNKFCILRLIKGPVAGGRIDS